MMDEDYIFLKKVTKVDGAFVTKEMEDVMRWGVVPILKLVFLWQERNERAYKKMLSCGLDPITEKRKEEAKRKVIIY